MKTPSRMNRLLLAALVLLLAVAAVWVWHYRQASPPPSSPPVAEQSAPATREVILYFGSPDATHLVAETRELKACDGEEACLRSTLRALLEGPTGELLPVLPPEAELREVSAGEDGLALVDFSSGLVDGHPGGSSSELLTVYALVDTLAANFPYVREMRLLIDGSPVETLKGHVDLSRPVGVDFSFTRPPEAAPP